jgi:hypothetical protein
VADALAARWCRGAGAGLSSAPGTTGAARGRRTDPSSPPGKTVETEIANLVAFVKQGKGSEAVQTELATAEVTRGTLRTALERLVATEALRTSTAHVEQTLTAILAADWQDIASKPVPQARQLLRKLLHDRLVVTPHVRGDRKWVDWHGSMALAPIVSGITPALGDALLMGRRWWPQRDAHIVGLGGPSTWWASP